MRLRNTKIAFKAALLSVSLYVAAHGAAQAQQVSGGQSGIQALSGDVTATGPGLATAVVGSYNGGTVFGTAAAANTGSSGATVPILNVADTVGAKWTFFTSTTGAASINVPCAAGVAPTSPADGDMWCTTAGVFVRVGSTTVGPLGAAGSGVPANLTLTNPASAATFTLLGGKTATINNTLTFSGTDATTMTFPATSASVARTDSGQTFTGTNNFAGVNLSIGGTFTTNSQVTIKASAITLSGCGGSAGTIKGTGSAAWGFTVGTSPPTTCTVTLPTATDGWACDAVDTTTNTEIPRETSTTATTAVFTYYAITTGLALAPTANDIIVGKCLAF